MGQVTIYLGKETEAKMRAFVKSMGLSQSRWIAGLIRKELQSEWPESIVAMSGAWKDLLSAEDIRAGMGQDITREKA
ncbi:MAG TPA: CopG family transcriptional regulator [Anaerolineae bacterium]|nr:CopG family transcriptional regulator [Anaerolineae bacterium]